MGKSPLIFLPICNNDIEFLNILLDNDFSVDVTDEHNKTPLIYCCENNKQEMLECIVNRTVKYNRHAVDDNGRNALYYVSVKNFDIDNIKLLIGDGHDINQKIIFDDGNNREVNTIIGLLIENNITNNSINELLDLGVNPNVRDSDGRNLLHVVCYHNIYNPNIIKKIIDGIEDINDIDMELNTPLLYLSTSNDVETLKLLLNIPDIDVNIKNIYGETPLINHISVNYDESDINVIKLLLENGTDIKHKDNSEKSALDYVKEIKDINIRSQIINLINKYSYD